MKAITVDTKLVALLGRPLRQSVSYITQNRVYEELGLDYCYFPLEVENPESLPPIIGSVRHMNYAGLAVTKPYKETIVPYLDEMDPSAAKIGACNTVCVRDGMLIGYNTDGIGCIKSLQMEGNLKLEGKRYLCFGAGGAARAVCFELAGHSAAEIVLVDINTNGQILADQINQYYPGLCRALFSHDTKQIEDAVYEADVILNMSGLGMAPHLDETPMDKKWFRSNQFCYDAIYQPEATRFLKEAAQAGCQTLNGLGMVVYQGIEQIKLWTGTSPKPEVMFDALQANKS